MGYKCFQCGEEKEKGSIFIQVRIVDEAGKEVYTRNCSDECANDTQRTYINLHQMRLNSVERQMFQRIICD